LTAVIEVDHLRKSYGERVAVRDVSFAVDRGEIFGILGPNGAGKTSTVECLQGLRRRTGGNVRVLGLDPDTHGSQLRARIGSQLQSSALPARIRVEEAMRLFADLAPSAESPDVLLQEWDLNGVRRQAYHSLSGGERQRLLIALALVNRPEIVFLDEVTTGLDPAARRSAWSIIERVRDRGTTVVLVTHYMEEARRLCDRVAIVNDGQVVAIDTPSGIIAGSRRRAVVSFTCPYSTDLSWLTQVPHVAGIVRDGDSVRVEGTGPVAQHVASALLSRGIEVPDFSSEKGELEDAYLSIVKQGAIP